MYKNHLSRLRGLGYSLFLQPFVAFAFMTLVLFCLNEVATSDILWAVGAGSLASSSFLVMGRPTGTSSYPINIVGGYLAGIVVGALVRFVVTSVFSFQGNWLGSVDYHVIGMMAALAVGLGFLVMVLLKLEHPPAVGMALVLVLDIHNYYVLIVVFAAAVLLALIRAMLFEHMKDLY